MSTDMHPNTNCANCKEEVRRESLLSHIKVNHPCYIWDHVFCTVNEHNPNDFTLRSRVNIRNAIRILQDERVPYELDEEVYVDFGYTTTFSKDKTAVKHILDHPLKHKLGMYQLLKDGLTEEKLLALLIWINKRPTQIIMDQKLIDAECSKVNEKLKNAMDEYILLTEQHEALRYAHIKYIKENEEFQLHKSEAKKQAYEASRTERIHLDDSMSAETHSDIESSRHKSLVNEQQAFNAYDILKQQCMKKVADIEKQMAKQTADYEKQMAKQTADYEKQMAKATHSFEKKEIKYTKEIKGLNHQIKGMKLSVVSDSDSD